MQRNATSWFNCTVAYAISALIGVFFAIHVTLIYRLKWRQCTCIALHGLIAAFMAICVRLLTLLYSSVGGTATDGSHQPQHKDCGQNQAGVHSIFHGCLIYEMLIWIDKRFPNRYVSEVRMFN
jgi:hypothetical protein